MRYPVYRYDAETKKGTLLVTQPYSTPIHGSPGELGRISLSAVGTLVIRPGYEWDFGSGPAIDDPTMIYASLAHDALYDLMNAHDFDGKFRKAADRYFIQLCKEIGMPWWRRAYVYAAVRVGYPIAKALGIRVTR